MTQAAPAAISVGQRVQPMSGARLGCGVALLTTAVYLLTANGHMLGQDQEYFYRMARSLALDGSFAVEPLVFGGRELAGGRSADGRFYAQYAPGLSTALAPLVLAGRGLAGPLSDLRAQYQWPYQDDGDLAARVLVSYFNGPVTGATAGLLAVLIVGLGYPRHAALVAAFAFAFASPAWGQARVVFAEPLQGLLILACVLLLLGATHLRALLGGTGLALAVLVKLTAGIALPALLLLPDSHGRALWRTPATVALILAPIAGALVLHGVYNAARFGTPLATGYTTGGGGGLDFGGNPLVGALGLLLSPGRGILWFAPPAAAAVYALRRFHGDRPDVASAFGALLLLWLAVHSLWKDWDAGWGWGPRYLMPVLPLVFVTLAAAWSGRFARLAIMSLIVLGVLVQVPGATVDFMASGSQGARQFSLQCPRCSLEQFANWRNFDPAGSELRWHTAELLAGKPDLALVTFKGTLLVQLTAGLAALVAVAGLGLLAGSAGQAAPLASGSFERGRDAPRPTSARGGRGKRRRSGR